MGFKSRKDLEKRKLKDIRGVQFLLFIALQANQVLSYAQTNLFPQHYGIATDAKIVFNPCLDDNSKKVELMLGNQFYTGLLNNVENHFFIGRLAILKDKSKKTQSNLGVKLANEKEGDYISRPKAYISYVLKIPISKRYTIAAGSYLGVASYSFKASKVSAGGTDIRPDMDFGISINSDKFTLGLSGNQLLNNKVLPKDYFFRWRRFYTFYVEKKLDVSATLAMVSYLQWQFLPQKKDGKDLGLYILYHDTFECGINYYTGESYSFIVGIRNLVFGQNTYKILFAFNLPQATAIQNKAQSLELLLSYKFGQ